MARIPPPATALRALARAALPQIYGLFIEGETNRIVTFNLLRSFYHLPSQAAARDLFNFATEYSGELSGIDREIRLGTITPGDVPLGENLPDPAAIARRYRYQLAVQAGDQWYTIPINSNSLLSIEQLTADATSSLLNWIAIYPKLAEFFNTNTADDINISIAGLFKRY